MAEYVTTTVTYSVPPADGVRAFQSTVKLDPISGARERNYTRKIPEVQVENIRGREDTVSLDTAGFQFYTSPAKYKGEFLDDEEIKRECYPESEELIKKLTGANKVVIFDHSKYISRSFPFCTIYSSQSLAIRRHTPGQFDGPGKRQPVQQVHVDQTTAASIARVHRHLPPDEAQALLERRFQIINLWRPISVPALEWPLALCDFRSVDPKNDVFTVALIYPDREGGAYAVKHNPNHKWKYVRGMTPDDFVLFKWCVDPLHN